MRISDWSSDVCSSDLVFVSGVTGFDYETMRISSDVTEQAEQCFRNIEKALQQGGCRLDEVVRVTYIIAERADFARLAPIFSRHFTKRRPAATAIVAGMIDPRMKLEIEEIGRAHV